MATLTREELVAKAHTRFLTLLEYHDTATLFSRYAKLMRSFSEETDDGARGMLWATEYELLNELYEAVFGEDLRAVKALTGGRTAAMLELFQEVMKAPLSSGSSEPTSGA